MKEILEKLYIQENKTREECAKILNMSFYSIRYNLHKYNIKKLKNTNLPNMTKEQLEIINGSLLGDGSLKNVRNTNNNCSFVKSQRIDRKEYLQWHFDKLIPYSSSISEKAVKLKFNYYSDRNLEKYSYSNYFITHHHSFFRDLSYKWYKNSNGIFEIKNNQVIKIIPNDLELTPLSLSIWFCDDGCADKKLHNCTLSTNCFSFEEVDFLISLLKKNFNLTCTMKTSRNQPIIFIPVNSYNDFMSIINPYMIWDCYKYKLDTNHYTANRIPRKNQKLTEKNVYEIFDLYKNGKSLTEISEIFNINKTPVIKILQRERWKHLNIKPIWKPIFNKLDKNIKNIIINLSNQGLTTKEIAKNLSLNYEQVRNVLRHKNKNKMDTIPYNEIKIINEIKEVFTKDCIISITNLSKKRINSILNKLQLPINKTKRLSSLNINKLKVYLYEGLSLKEISWKLSISLDKIEKAINFLGIPTQFYDYVI